MLPNAIKYSALQKSGLPEMWSELESQVPWRTQSVLLFPSGLSPPPSPRGWRWLTGRNLCLRLGMPFPVAPQFTEGMKTVSLPVTQANFIRRSPSLWFAKWLKPALTAKRLVEQIDTISVELFIHLDSLWIKTSLLLVSWVIYNVLDCGLES